jgi:hypothetical protein
LREIPDSAAGRIDNQFEWEGPLKRLISILALCGLTLAAQAQAPVQPLGGKPAVAPPKAAATTVNVTVAGKQIVANATLRPTAAAQTVVWKLGTAGYVFAGDGITFSGGVSPYTCTVSTDRKTLTCSKPAAPQPPAKLGYQLLVEPTDTAKPKPVSPDYWIQSD